MAQGVEVHPAGGKFPNCTRDVGRATALGLRV